MKFGRFLSKPNTQDCVRRPPPRLAPATEDMTDVATRPWRTPLPRAAGPGPILHPGVCKRSTPCGFPQDDENYTTSVALLSNRRMAKLRAARIDNDTSRGKMRLWCGRNRGRFAAPVFHEKRPGYLLIGPVDIFRPFSSPSHIAHDRRAKVRRGKGLLRHLAYEGRPPQRCAAVPACEPTPHFRVPASPSLASPSPAYLPPPSQAASTTAFSSAP